MLLSRLVRIFNSIKVMNHTFTYSLSDTENLIFSGTSSKFDIFSKPEGGSQDLIARFNAGKWSFDNHQQRQLFLTLFDNNRQGFYKGVKSFLRSLKERPKLYEFTCIRRRFNIKVTKLRSTLWDKMYSIFYGR